MITDISHIRNIFQQSSEKEQEAEDDASIYLPLLQYYVLCGELNEEKMRIINEKIHKTTSAGCKRVLEMSNDYCKGNYMKILGSETALKMFGKENEEVLMDKKKEDPGGSVLISMIQERVDAYCNITKTDAPSSSDIEKMIEVELIGISALNLYLQMNYSGPSLTKELEEEMTILNPHSAFRSLLMLPAMDNVNSGEDGDNDNDKRNKYYTNAILSELSVDGEWPHQLSDGPYFLLLARSILLCLSKKSDSKINWLNPAKCQDTIEVVGLFDGITDDEDTEDLSTNPRSDFSNFVRNIWSARAAVAHQRLLNSNKSSDTLWNEVKEIYQSSSLYLESIKNQNDNNPLHCKLEITAMLEYGLAQHHFDILRNGRDSFQKALKLSKLQVEVTGAFGKRTKFQTKATAQMIVKAKPAVIANTNNTGDEVEENKNNSSVVIEAVKHSEDEAILDYVRYEDESNNQHQQLNFLELSILLALCLDVKNQNPNDCILTGEEMGAYLERALVDHNDWMIYSTALLERAWLEFENTHKRERALLQLQALADQHTNRLTITQSTFQSVTEHSAPVQDRLRNIHTIVYPPRWALQRDLAERYTAIGIFSSAADIYETLESWDEVVRCLQFSGRETRAKDLVERRLKECETPRMWSALGDLTKDPTHYEKAIELSNHRFFDAYAGLGRYHLDNGDLTKASSLLQEGLAIKPLATRTWFLLGTISMKLDEWDTALNAFSQVVQQDSEEGDAWANIAAIHIKNKDPSKAYHALNESLRQNRNNWRVWISKLYACIDLKKYDEAIMSCHQLLKFQQKKLDTKDSILIEEKCIKAIVGGCIAEYHEARASNDPAAIQSTKRSLERVNDLLESIGASMTSDGWIWETRALLNSHIGNDTNKILQDLSKEYRILQAYKGWETDDVRRDKVFKVALDIYEIQKDFCTERSDLIKCKYMLSGLIKKIHAAFLNESDYPSELSLLEKALGDVEIKIEKNVT